jgi:hypothetical protein
MSRVVDELGAGEGLRGRRVGDIEDDFRRSTVWTSSRGLFELRKCVYNHRHQKNIEKGEKSVVEHGDEGRETGWVMPKIVGSFCTLSLNSPCSYQFQQLSTPLVPRVSFIYQKVWSRLFRHKGETLLHCTLALIFLVKSLFIDS